MFVYIKGNEIVYISDKNNEDIDYTEIREVSGIKMPILYKGEIIEHGTEGEFWKVIRDKIIALPVEDLKNITKEFLKGERLFEEDFDYILQKRMYPEGLEYKFRELMFQMATGNFSAGQELGYLMRNEYNTLNGVKNIILSNK